ncbi:ParB/RepB/Spo0J family partition protein [Ancylothrix sp. C2]|uniref:ParB/RepB/Spo0J family partition protein n=1 Tax=Ancylothrix sp. D3o TaxID=2953691 RepID=UPI0021BB1366|nr:ParB/RepB/Spo0J family partition protein [Ancylothrix sp. D3o]MCT7953019.1 ParB/RepB/Spo0J family partition protein [Ancylothrix sp. D3o]
MAKLPKISDRFTNAIQATDQAQRIAELQAEVERLRASQSPELEPQIEELRKELLAEEGELEIAVDAIDPNLYQPRQTITSESIQTIARSMEKDGQIAPIIVITQGERYLLWDGQRRWSAAKLLGWKTLRAVKALMPEDLHRKALLTFIHHEDLNSLDKAEAIIKELTTSTGMGVEEIPTTLSTVLRRLERSGEANQLSALVTATTEAQVQGIKSLGVNENEEKILLALLDLALNPASVKANLMPMLSLPKDLKKAIRERGLKGAHALALTVISAKSLKISERQAKKERIEATNRVIEQDLTVPKTRELVAKIKAKYLKPEVSESREVTAIVKGVEKLSRAVIVSTSPEQLVELRQVLQQKLSEIDDVLNQ